MKIYIAKVFNGVVDVSESEAKVENDLVSFSGGIKLVVADYKRFCAEGYYIWFEDGVNHCFSAVAKTRKQALKVLAAHFESQMKEAAREVSEFSRKLGVSKKKMHAAHEIVQKIRAAG